LYLSNEFAVGGQHQTTGGYKGIGKSNYGLICVVATSGSSGEVRDIKAIKMAKNLFMPLPLTINKLNFLSQPIEND